MNFSYSKDSKGFTLVEILVSITILSIIVVTFLTFFIQSAKTNTYSEDVLDATYVAQSEMEELYKLGTKVPFEEVNVELEKLSYPSFAGAGSITSTKVIDDYTITLYIDKPGQKDNLGNVLIEVRNKSGKMQAQMETTIKWKQAEGV